MKQLAILCLVLASTFSVVGCGGGSFQQPNKFATGNPPTPNNNNVPAPGTTTTTTTGSDMSGVQVTLQSPAAGASSDPVTVQASASSSQAIGGWAVYADDKPVYQDQDSKTSLSAQISLGSGTHKLYVRAWDAKGAFGTSPTTQVQVNGATASAAADNSSQSSALPTPPADATVFTNLQNDTDGWKSCSDCAWGTNKTSNYWMAPFTSSPSLSGSSRELFVGGPQWTNALFIKTLKGHKQAWHFLWDYWVYFDSTSNAHIWSAEFDLWQQVNGEQFMMGTQCNFGNGEWDVWDEPHNKWIPTDKPCPRWKPATWHHVQWYMERGNHKYHYGTVVLDGKAITFNKEYGTISNGWADAVGVQWQLDQDSSGVDLHEWIDKVKLTMW